MIVCSVHVILKQYKGETRPLVGIHVAKKATTCLALIQSIDLHPVCIWIWPRRGHLSTAAGRFHLGCERSICTSAHVGFLFILDSLRLVDVRLEALVVVVRANASVGNCDEDQDDGENGERGQFLSCW